MNIQVLVATMNQKDYSLLSKMNIQTNAIIGNQCDRNAIEHFIYNGCKISYFNFNERGVGLNRNNALMRADGDICLFADDDLVYYDDYASLIENAFIRHSDADVIIFNVNERIGNDVTPVRPNNRDIRVRWFNFLRYGAVRIAIKRKSIIENTIYFNQGFGGGTEHGSGEDSLFLWDCLSHKLKIYAVPECIAELNNNRDSTWFYGYDEKYFHDRGFLYKTMTKRWWKFFCLQDAIRHQKLYQKSWLSVYKMMLQ